MEAVDKYLVRTEDGLMTAVHAAFRGQPCTIPATSRAIPPASAKMAGNIPTACCGAIVAFAMLGNGDRAGELFSMLNPDQSCAHRARQPQRYRVEPYVACGDVYSDAAAMSGAAAGPGIPARRPGCTASAIEYMLGLRLCRATC